MAKGGAQTGGVKPMNISGRLTSERERLFGMTDEERTFRRQWLKDQELAISEPREVPELYKALNNPIKRFYRAPLEALGRALEPVFGKERAGNIRYMTGKIGLGILGAYIFTYYVKYNANDWTRTGGLRVLRSREAVYPGDPGFPKLSDKSVGADYATRGFDKVTLNL